MANKQTPSHPNIYSHPDSSEPRIHFRHAYSPQYPVRLEFPPEGRTKQSFKDECDINNIMRRFELTGEISHLGARTPIFGDFPDMDFAQAMAVVTMARERFSELPAAVRDRFANDPGRLLAFLEDPSNREEAVKLGLVQAPAVVPPSETPQPKAAE